jgi:hypothetical protein
VADPVTVDAPLAKLPGEPGDAAREFFETALGMSVQTGPQVSIAAFGALPGSTQKQYLENSANRDRLSFDRDRMGFELEQKQIDAEGKEKDAQRAHERAVRDAERAHELAKWERSQAQNETSDRRAFWFVVGVLAAAAGE